MADEQDHVTLAVLAGGQATRMGRPKAELRIQGLPILRHLLNRLDWSGPTMLVTSPGREHPPASADFDREVIDPEPGLGPLRGVLTALENSSTELVLVITVDMPGISPAQLDWLVAALRDHPKRAGVMAFRPIETGKQIEPFPCAIRRSAVQLIGSQLSSGKSSVRELANLPGFLAVHAVEEWRQSVWLNLNYPEDLARWMRETGESVD